MKTSDTIGELLTALSAAQGEFPTVPFDRTNPHFKSRYATLASIVEAVRPVMAIHGLSAIQSARIDAGEVVVVCRIAHKSGQWIEGEFASVPMKNDPQGRGAALTYGRRYLLSAMLGIAADEDDDGNAASQPSKAKPAVTPKPTHPPKDTNPPKPIHPTPVSAQAPAPVEDATIIPTSHTSAGDFARAIEEAREAAKLAGFKARKDVFEFASLKAGRDVTEWTHLTVDELRTVTAGFICLKEQPNGEK